MKDYNWNPFKKDWRSSDEYSNSNWNFDQRDENYYLGKINNSGANDMTREYFSDGHSDKFYRRSELDNQKNYPQVAPYKNNDYFGTRKRKYPLEGPNRGKGPKNYSRSSDRIKDDVADKLMEDAQVDASDIEVKVKGNQVILSGTVNSLFEKHRAEGLAEYVSGVIEVQNNLRVKGEKERIPHTFG